MVGAGFAQRRLGRPSRNGAGREDGSGELSHNDGLGALLGIFLAGTTIFSSLVREPVIIRGGLRLRPRIAPACPEFYERGKSCSRQILSYRREHRPREIGSAERTNASELAPYGVPRRFGLASMLVVTAAFAGLFALLQPLVSTSLW